MIILKTIRTLLTYLILGLPLLLIFGCLLPFINSTTMNYPFKVWFAIDVAICAIAHNTYRRSISGWTGQHALTKKRYYYQAKIIDFILVLCGDSPDHCYRSYLWELKQGLVK